MSKPQIIRVKISDLVTNKGTQMRACLNQKNIEGLREKIAEWKALPDPDRERGFPLDAPDAIRDAEGHIYPWDGFHRIAGYKAEKVAEIDIRVTDGTLSDARRLAYGANSKHGEKRSRADIKYIVEKLLADKEVMASNPSNMELARISGINESTFRKARPVQAGEAPRTGTTKTGETVTRSAKNIGKKGGKAEKPAAKNQPATPPKLEDLDDDAQKAVRKITNAIGGDKGKATREAIVDGSLKISRPELIALAEHTPSKIQGAATLIVDSRIKPSEAIRIIDNTVTGKTKVADLILSAIAHGGRVDEKIDGEGKFRVLVYDSSVIHVISNPAPKAARKPDPIEEPEFPAMAAPVEEFADSV